MNKRIFVMSVLSAFMFVGCGNEVDNNQKESNEAEQIQITEKQSGITIDHEVNSETQNDYDETASRLDKIFLIKEMLNDSFEDIGRVSYDYEYDMIDIMPTEPGFIEDIYRVMYEGEDATAWNSLSRNVAEMSIAISEVVDSDIRVSILVPGSEDKILLLVRDGTVIYNFIDEVD